MEAKYNFMIYCLLALTDMGIDFTMDQITIDSFNIKGQDITIVYEWKKYNPSTILAINRHNDQYPLFILLSFLNNRNKAKSRSRFWSKVNNRSFIFNVIYRKGLFLV